MELLILGFELILIFLILYSYLGNLGDAIIIGFIFFNAIIVFIAEALSIFSYYNLVGNIIVWGSIAFFTIFLFHTRIKVGYQKIRNNIRKIEFSICGGGNMVGCGREYSNYSN